MERETVCKRETLFCILRMFLLQTIDHVFHGITLFLSVYLFPSHRLRCSNTHANRILYIMCTHLLRSWLVHSFHVHVFTLSKFCYIMCTVYTVHYCTVCLFDGYRCIRHLLLLLHLLFLKSFTLSAYFSFSSSVLSAFWLCYECYFDGFRTFHCENSICKISHIFY